jgi:hypothetical protein
MAEVQIKFSKRNQEAVLNNNKSCTSRREIKGMEGDFFKINDRVFKIEDLQPTFLEDVALTLYKEEGYESPDAFITDWKKLHRGHYNRDQVVIVHHFRELKHITE